jgi:hypothetical protein
MKKIRGDKPVGVIIHTYMEISQGNSLCIYLYLKQAKMSFVFVLYLFLLQNPRAGGQDLREGWYQWEGGGGRERE